jgi:biopolymer transport protein TolR
MLQQGLEVELPKTTTQNLRLQKEPLVMTVRKDGKIFLARREIPIAELQEKLTAILEDLDDKEIFLKADAGAQYGTVVKALAAARAAGAEKLGMVTEPES